MENKDAQLIRRYMNLLESIETKIIVEDDSTDINEDLIASAAREGKLVASELEGFLKGMRKEASISAELTKAGIRDAEELLAALKGNRLTATLKGSLELNILKSQTTNTKLIDLATENLTRNQQFLQKYSNEIKQGQPQFEAALKKAGYSDRAITKIVEKAYLKKSSGLKTVASQDKELANKQLVGPERLKAKLEASRKAKVVINDTKNITIINIIQKWIKEGKDTFNIIINNGVKKITISKRLRNLALALGGGFILYSLLSSKGDGSDVELVDENGKQIPLTPEKDGWATCIQDLLNNKSGKLVATQSGQVYVAVGKTGNSEYDDAGGLKFYMNGRVMTLDNSKKGSWVCNSGKVKTVDESLINEQSGEVSAQQLQKAAKELDDQLSGDFFEGDSTDMQDALNVVKQFDGKTYKGKSAVEVLKSAYKKVSGSDLVNDFKTKLKNLDFVGSEAKSDALTILGGSSNTTTTTKGDLSGINITWDGEQGGGDDGGGGNDITPTPTPKKTKYHDCSDFPMVMGCKSPRIKELQYCLGMESKYQTGNFGPKTYDAIAARFREASKNEVGVSGAGAVGLLRIKSEGLSQDMFNNMIKNCKGRKEDTKPVTTTTGSTTGSTTTTTTTPEKPKTDTVPTASTTTKVGMTPDELYRKLVKDKTLFGRLRGRRIVYKGPDLSKDDYEKLVQYMTSTGYRLSRFNNDYNKGDKLVFKRNKAGEPETANIPPAEPKI